MQNRLTRPHNQKNLTNSRSCYLQKPFTLSDSKIQGKRTLRKLKKEETSRNSKPKTKNDWKEY